jgi:quercetin dioxygenase-like cupin family protein
MMKIQSAYAVAAVLVFGLNMGAGAGPRNDDTSLTMPAQNVEQVKTIFEHVIPNIEGKSMVAVVVTYPPGGKSPAHYHARSAFIYAHVLSGSIRSQVGDEPAKLYQVGDGFYELPGSHHRISENASDKDPASLLAVFVVDSKDKPLTIPDQK